MTIQELKSKYSEKDLSLFPGDKKLRFEIFSPLFENLYEKKLIYYEKLLGIVKVKDLVITPNELSVTVVPDRCIIRDDEFDSLFFKLPDWTFSASWDWIRLIDQSLNVPYANWTVWTEPSLVKEVESLCVAEEYNKALELFF